jgi:hypothetical protein
VDGRWPHSVRGLIDPHLTAAGYTVVRGPTRAGPSHSS